MQEFNGRRGEMESLMLRGREVAATLGISYAAAYRWMKNGTLPVVRVGKAVRVPRAALVQWIEQSTTRQPAA